MSNALRSSALFALTLTVAVAGMPTAHAADPAEVAPDPSAVASWRIDDAATPSVGDDTAPAAWDATDTVAPIPATTAPTLQPEVTTAEGLPPASDGAPATSADDAERARVVSKGKTLMTAGSILGLVSVAGLITTAVFSVRGNTRGAIGAAGVSLLFAGTGLALVVPGRKRVRTPERYMKTPRATVSLAPVLSRKTQGAALSVRF